MGDFDSSEISARISQGGNHNTIDRPLEIGQGLTMLVDRLTGNEPLELPLPHDMDLASLGSELSEHLVLEIGEAA